VLAGDPAAEVDVEPTEISSAKLKRDEHLWF
jgi:hypothetical protein